MNKLRRFLTCISEECKISASTNSYYYKIRRGDKYYTVRLSDHSADRNGIDISIIFIQLSNIIIISTDKFQITFSLNEYLIYFKSFFLLLPWLDNSGYLKINKPLQKSYQKKCNEYNVLNNKLKEIQKTISFEESYKMLEKNKDLENEIIALNKQINELKVSNESKLKHIKNLLYNFKNAVECQL